ncbi:MAG: hypothetical protein RJA99_3054 [Pseudomonadota bacterium]
MTRWLVSKLRTVPARALPPAGRAAPPDLLPAEIAERFREDPDFYLAASIGDDDLRVQSGGRTSFAFDVRVAGHVIASVRGGSISIGADGETTAEIAHFSITGPHRRRGLGVMVARALFRWLNARHGVTRMLFVLPVQRQQRTVFRAFVERLGAEPWGHFAGDPVAPPLFAWSVRRALG